MPYSFLSPSPPVHRFLSERRADDGRQRVGDGVQRRTGRRVRARVHAGRGAESSLRLRTGHQPAAILHHLRPAGGIRALLCVSAVLIKPKG